MTILDEMVDFIERKSFAEELIQVCDALFKGDLICDRCHTLLKANIYFVITDERNVGTAFDKDGKAMVNLHQSCIINIFSFFSIPFLGENASILKEALEHGKKDNDI